MFGEGFQRIAQESGEDADSEGCAGNDKPLFVLIVHWGCVKIVPLRYAIKALV